MEGDGDLVAAAIMAMQQTDSEHDPESTILHVVAQAECPGDGQVENQIMVQSDGEIIVQQHPASALQELQQQGVETAGQQRVQDGAVVGAAAPQDPTTLTVEMHEVTGMDVQTVPITCASEQTNDEAMQQGIGGRFLQESIGPVTPLEVVQEATEVDIQSIDENVTKLCKKYLSDVKEVDKDYLRGFHEGPGISFEEFLSKYFCVTGTSFVAVSNRSRTMPSTGQQRQSRYYGNCEGRIRWEAKGGTLPIEFCGSPFKIESSMYLHCLHGPKRDLRTKEPKPPKSGRRGRPRKTTNKKLECPASIQVREISMYTNECYFVDKKEFKNVSKLRWEKQRILKKIREDEGNGKEVTTVRRLYIKLPYVRVHSSLHPVGENSSVNQTMDYRVSQKLKQLIANNVTNINEIKKCLKHYVDDVLFKHNPLEKKPKPNNRKFYPSPADLQRQIAAALSNTVENADVLAEKIKEWQAKGTGRFMYRPHKADSEQSFLFVHQEKWQQRLMERYGSDLVMLDATSKSNTVLTMATPLYSLCIHTNVNFIVVAVFVVEKETVANIREALGIIRTWNPWWSPSSFMVDKCSTEITAVKEVLPNVRIYISDYHRRQALARWIGRKESGLDAEQQKMVTVQMDKIASEQNQTLYSSAKKELLSSKMVTENEEFQDYLQSEWFSCPEMWAHAYRDYAIDNLINVNNGEVAMERFLHFTSIPKSREKGVGGIVTLIVESYLPDSFNKYRKKNNVWKYSRFPAQAQNVPPDLRDRPAHFVRECLLSQSEAARYSNIDVQLIDATHGVFNVRSKKGFHIASFLGPSCTCSHWRKYRFPCKHFFAIFQHFYEWGFNRLPDLYINSVFLTRDTGVFQDPPADGAGVPQDFQPLEIQVTISGAEACPTETVTVATTSDAGASFAASMPNPIPVNLISIPDLDEGSSSAQDFEPNPDKQAKIMNIFKRGMDLITDICDPQLITETEEVLSHMVTKLQRRVTHDHYMQKALPSIKRLKPNPPPQQPPPQMQPAHDQQQQHQEQQQQQPGQVSLECVSSSYW
ncbi:uncharacterized protein LOC110975771 [Acanthaster planci]|uniref:Uncharacterized protein LOC110975771 n=1 Tax=Acanthaster planci TaxID=133434 RepID=A0A8B7XTR0_ACAPL|nr:uncharacterized protein LOC110975771 [Acanthaster planci]